MLILLLFAFISGLVTIAAPCIWPLLPIILSSSSTGGHRKPLGITMGIATSFAFFTLALSYIVKIIPLDPNALRLFAVAIISFFGLTLLVPALNRVVEGYVSRLSGKLGISANNSSGFKTGFLTGFSLGIVWSPCAGPILATIATLAATHSVNLEIILITLAYVTGVSVPLFIFSYIGNNLFTQSKVLNRYTGRIQQVFGVVMIATALLILTNFDKSLQASLLERFPIATNFVTNLENNNAVKSQLSKLRSLPESTNQAPEFAGIAKWLNLPANKTVLTMEGLRGKVVLVDFWTYTCINCIRTLPHITSLYEKYKDKGFVVVGVHTPEFEFEKKTENVQAALKQFKINYPVAQDNDYATWNAYSNQYWPAHYLIDAKGIIRDTHFGEGNYEETELAVQALLKEAGENVEMKTDDIPDLTPQTRLSPETYLGNNRTERMSDSTTPPTNYYSLTGKWDHTDQFISSKKGSTLTFHFYADKVYLVMGPRNSGDAVKVIVDGKFTQTITLDRQRLYTLVDLKESVGDHLLKLEFMNDGTEVFAFTFG